METAFEINLDWLSWTIPVAEIFDNELDHAAFILADIERHFPELQINPNPKEFGRGVYRWCFDLDISGKVFFKHGVSNYLVEVSGIGCHRLEQREQMHDVITQVLPRCLNVTRIDLAVDYETDILPQDFAAMRSAKWTYTDHVNSDTGNTFYVGSKDSDRQAKVYRYHPPHERSHLLRIEMTYRKKGGAWAALMMYLEEGKIATASTMGETFKWGHELWNLESDQRIKSYRIETGSASTKRWIRSAVIPALRRLYGDGILDKDHPIWAELAEGLPLSVDTE